MKKSSDTKKNVLIIQWLIKHYRKPFYDQLHQSLLKKNYALKVVYSKPRDFEALKKDNVDLDPGYSSKVNSSWFMKEKVLLQHVIKEIIWADYIIVEHANKHIINYFLIILFDLQVIHWNR